MSRRGALLQSGELVDVTAIAREAGFRHPVALTRAAWDACVAWSAADAARTGALQDEDGRLWDVLWMVSRAAQEDPDAASIDFSVVRIDRGLVPEPDEYPQATPVALVVTIATTDGYAAITIGLAGEA